MTDSVSSANAMPMWRMPHRRPQQENTATDATQKPTDAKATAASTDAAPAEQQWNPQADGNAPEGFRGFEGKFPNFGGGNVGPGMMPPFGQRETFM